jgi:hypothetical protein
MSICRKISRILPLLVFLAGFSPAVMAQAQNTTSDPPRKKKGALYLQWGYNRDQYTKSDIRFVNKKTDNYDFTFLNAKASDKPSVWHWYDLNRLTIPQYDLHLGYMFNDKHDLGIELAWNHLKYVVNDNQMIHVKGEVRGKYIDKDTLVTPSFVHLQHTNGNNYALLNIVKRQELWASKHVQVGVIGKFGLGPLMSVTISDVLGSYHRTGFQYQGWVFAASAGLRINLYKYLFIQGDVQGALADYLDSKIRADSQGRATQHFYSLQWMWAGGICVPLRL